MILFTRIKMMNNLQGQVTLCIIKQDKANILILMNSNPELIKKAPYKNIKMKALLQKRL
jgi:hypothetical protein